MSLSEFGPQSEDVTQRVNSVLRLIDLAGSEALDIQGTLSDSDVQHKTADLANLVTTGDLRVKKVLVEEIKRRFPQDSIYSEETSGALVSSGRFGWRIDEIDGTIAYRHNFPEWGISVGLEVDGQVIFGIVDFPALRRRLSAYLGKGATENDKLIRTTRFTSLDEVIVFTADPYLRSEEQLQHIVYPFKSAFAGKVQAVYSEPCGVMTMARLARGEIGVFLHTGGLGTKDDLGAGPLIIKEAGGVHSRIDVTKDRQTFLACANQELYDQVVELLGSELINRINLSV